MVISDAFKISLIRAARTGLQAGIGVIVASQAGWLEMSVLQGALVAAGAAFFSAFTVNSSSNFSVKKDPGNS